MWSYLTVHGIITAINNENGNMLYVYKVIRHCQIKHLQNSKKILEKCFDCFVSFSYYYIIFLYKLYVYEVRYIIVQVRCLYKFSLQKLGMENVEDIPKGSALKNLLGYNIGYRHFRDFIFSKLGMALFFYTSSFMGYRLT